MFIQNWSKAASVVAAFLLIALIAMAATPALRYASELPNSNRIAVSGVLRRGTAICKLRLPNWLTCQSTMNCICGIRLRVMPAAAWIRTAAINTRNSFSKAKSIRDWSNSVTKMARCAWSASSMFSAMAFLLSIRSTIPTRHNAPYGTYNVLWQIEQARLLNMPYIYLGYWIQESPKMSYKINFQPLEALQNGQWQPLVSA